MAPGDVLEFRVLAGSDSSEMNTVQQVRADGRITLPMIDDQVVSGLTLQELRKLLQRQHLEHGYLKQTAVEGIAGPPPRPCAAGRTGGRGWDRTSGLPRVNGERVGTGGD